MRTRLISTLLVACAMLLGACGGDEGLLASGSVTVEGTDLSTGFSFPADVRIDGIDAGGDGRIRGTCDMNRVYDIPQEDHYGVVVEILRGFESDDDRALTSLTVMQRTDAPAENGRIEVMLGTTAYTSREGECQMAVEYAASGMVGLTGACDVYDADGESVNTVVSLDLAGCTVTE
ncbi:MAG: hypothetical protein AB8I08_28035 [Sandaracinaceae bacterium]